MGIKILAIGDFHGKFQKKWAKIVKKEKIDVVVSNGDYPPFHYRKLWFKHCFGTDKELCEIIGRKKYRELVMEDMRRGEEALKGLNKLDVPVLTVLGNIDYPSVDDISDARSSDRKSKKNNMPNWDRKELFSNRLKKYKGIKRFDYKAVRVGEYVFIGMRGHSNPGKVMSKAFRKHKAKLDKLFGKFRKENRGGKVIFVGHNVPYNTKLDKIGMKAHPAVRGKHYGSKMARRVISKWQPVFFMGGHIHEGRGKDKIRKTVCVNPGSAHEGKAAIVEIDDKGKVKVKFVG